MNKTLKKIKDVSFKFFNFFFLLPVYFIGIGISHLLWHFVSKREESHNWILSKELVKKIESYEETY